MITSTANPQVKHLIQLQNKAKAREEEGVFVCEGIKIYEELLTWRPELLVKTYISESYRKEMLAHPPQRAAGAEPEVLSDSVFKEAAQTVTPQGILAIVKQPRYEIEELLKKENLRIVFLENLRDPGNLGTIMRTAEGAGMDAVILSPGSVDIYNPKVIRSTMGSVFRVPFLYAEDTETMLKQLQAAGVRLYAAYLTGSEEYDKTEYAGKAAVIIGNEANGITPETAALSDYRIRIPMAGHLESLNAAVAAALIMYQARRR